MEWNPIDTAPKGEPGSYPKGSGPRIICASENGYVFIARWEWHRNGKTGNWKDGGRVSFWPPANWMPLPEPPEDAA